MYLKKGMLFKNGTLSTEIEYKQGIWGEKYICISYIYMCVCVCVCVPDYRI